MKVRYTTTVDHLMAFHRYHVSRSAVMKLRKYVIPPVVIALVFLAMYRIARPGREIEYYKFAALFSVIFLFTNWLGIKAGEWSARSAYGRKGTNKTVLCEHVLEITPDGLVETTPFGGTRNTWNAIEAVVETSDFLFIYVQANAAHVVPLRSLSEGDASQFHRELITRVGTAS